jgi:hypothetical protein
MALVGAVGFPRPGVQETPVWVSPADPMIRYVGRFDRRKPEEPRCSWPGSAIMVRFRGTAVSARLRSTKGEDYFEVNIDGTQSSTARISEEKSSTLLTRGLASGEHTLELVKRTEAMSSTVSFLGFELEKDGKVVPLPARPRRRIEVYGDSVSCGNSCEGAGPNENMSRRTSNSHLAYGAVAARALSAEYTCIAWSGRKLLPANSLREVHDLTLAPWDNAPKWDYSWIPQAVVINLGSNDYGNGKYPEENAWTEAYVAFIKEFRGRYPQCAVFCCLCGSIVGKDREPMRRLTRRAVERQKAEGDRKVHFVELPEMSGDGMIGPGWHPTVKCHALMGEALAKSIKALMEW